MRLARWLVGAALLGGAVPSWAREYDVQILIEDVDDLYDLQEAGELEEEDVELLVALFYRPLDINRADRYLLFELPEITYDLADAIVAYRAEHGAYADVYDLRRVPGVTDAVFDSILPFVTVTAAAEEESPSTVRGTARVGYVRSDDLSDQEEGSGRITAINPYNAYLHFEATGMSYFGVGGLLTLRPMVSPVWNYSTGALASEPEAHSVNLEGLNAWMSYGPWHAALGHYNIGFGERLTFDSTRRAHPDGWDERLAPTLRRDEAKVRGKRAMRGAALSLDGLELPVGWVDASAFASYQQHDLYQYDVWYEPDAFFTGVESCMTDGDCPDGYECRPDNHCYSSRIYSTEDGESLMYQTIEDGYTETVFGGHASYNLDERTRLGLLAYRSQIAFNFGEPGAPNFSWSSGYPRDPVFGAAGLYGSAGIGPAELAGELSSTLEGDLAGTLRAVVDPTDWAEVELGVRAFGRDYQNPYSRATSSRLEVFGSTRRAQRGARMDVVLKPARRLRLRTYVDLYETPWAHEYDDAGSLHWSRDPVRYVRVSERVSYGPTPREELSLQLDYNNNDLENGGREETYLSEGVDDHFRRAVGRGERRVIRLGVKSERVPATTISAVYMAAWEDAELGDRFDTEQSIGLSASARPWQGGRLRLGARVYVDDEVSDDLFDRVATISLKQELYDLVSVGVMVGVLGEELSNGWEYEQIGLVQVESRF